MILKGYSNPIIPPPSISEIYLNGNIIQIEFYIEFGSWIYLYENFNSINLVSSIDTVEFNDGLEIIFDEIWVVDQNDLKESFEYNPEGDHIRMMDDDGYFIGDYEYASFCFGNLPCANFPAPNENQSFGFKYILDQSTWEHTFLIGLEEPPTIGSNEFDLQATGYVKGVVYDLNNNPISGAEIHYPYYPLIMYTEYSDSAGNFMLYDLICRNYSFTIYKSGASKSFDVSIYPYDTSYVEVQLDTVFVGIPEYNNYPNPFSGSTSFNIQIPDNLNYNSAYVCIYNMSGKLVDRIEVPKDQSSVNWQNFENEPGIYLYNLVVDNKKYVSHKMIIL
jgi:hypothetical protein